MDSIKIFKSAKKSGDPISTRVAAYSIWLDGY